MRPQTVLALSVLAAVPVAGVVALLLLRRRIHTRWDAVRRIHADPDVAEWLIAFDWTGKVLYLPTVLAALVAAAVMLAVQLVSSMPYVPGTVVGGIWLGVLVLNVLVEEGRFGWRGLLALVLAAALAAGLLHLAGWLRPALRAASRIEVSLSAGAYLVVVAVGLAAVLASWLRGVAHFVAITPKHVLIGRGLITPPERIAYSDVTVAIDTSDLLKRLVGFGRVVVTFRDVSRAPLVLLVGRVGAKAAMLKAVRRQADREASIVTAQVVDDPPK